MKQAKLIVVKKNYVGDSAIENVLGYVIDSYFADLDEIITHHVRYDTYEHMIEDFYLTQASRDMNDHRRLFHFVLSTPVSKTMCRTLDEGTRDLLDFFEELGHQVVAVPHDASANNCLHYHWHIIANSVSYKTGKLLYDRYETYNAIIDYLNQSPHTNWNWVYGN